MIVKTFVLGKYVHIEHDDSVGPEGRIYVLRSEANNHPSFAMGTQLARAVAKELWTLTGGAVAMNTTHREQAADYATMLRAAAGIATDGADLMRNVADFLDRLYA